MFRRKVRDLRIGHKKAAVSVLRRTTFSSGKQIGTSLLAGTKYPASTPVPFFDTVSACLIKMHTLITIVVTLLAPSTEALPQVQPSLTIDKPTGSLALLPLSSVYVPTPSAYKSCGGFRMVPKTCAEGYDCIDDARIQNSCGMACDRPGICVRNLDLCGGIAGFRCPKGME
jgi:hypothetical protein